MGRRSFSIGNRRDAFKRFLLFGFALCMGVAFASGAHAFILNVTDSDGKPVTSYRWLLEEDNTNLTVPGANVSDSISNSIHNSYAPVVSRGTAGTASVVVDIPASMSDSRFYGFGSHEPDLQKYVNLPVPCPFGQILIAIMFCGR